MTDSTLGEFFSKDDQKIRIKADIYDLLRRLNYHLSQKAMLEENIKRLESSLTEIESIDKKEQENAV